LFSFLFYFKQKTLSFIHPIRDAKGNKARDTRLRKRRSLAKEAIAPCLFYVLIEEQDYFVFILGQSLHIADRFLFFH